MSLVGEVAAYLGKRRIKCALIGGEALAVHGVARATLDSDLLVATSDVLRGPFWSDLSPAATVEIRRGDPDDPLAGAARIHRRTEQTDVIVGRPWVRPMLDRGLRIRIGSDDLPVVDRADLILLKLFAAGPQDLLDVRLLLESEEDETTAHVESRLSGVPQEVVRAWRRLRRTSPHH